MAPNRYLPHARRWNPTLDRLAFLGAVLALGIAPAGADCQNADDGAPRLGVARIVEVDTSEGPVFGAMTKRPHEELLGPHEIVLSFDDGPMPWITRSILATLKRHCTRATFFSVGKMAIAYPGVLREELEKGHTVGTHTWSHPLNLNRLKSEAAVAEIDRGFAAVSAAAGHPIAPFFRFPGLSDSTFLVEQLSQRHVASFTVDVVSNDSFISDPARLTRETLAKVEANHGGIILFHDIKASTAKALPGILDALAERDYKVVHLVPKAAVEPNAQMVAGFEPQVAKQLDAKTKTALMPFFGAVGPTPAAELDRDDKRAERKSGAEPRRRRGSKAPAVSVGASWATSVQHGD